MKCSVVLNKKQRAYLREYVSKGVHPARSMRRAQALLFLSEGVSQVQVAERVGCCLATITNLIAHYREVNGDVTQAIEERPRPGQPRLITADVEAHITALACSQGPDGREEWTLRLLAGKAVELGYVEHLSHEAVRGVLKKVNSNPGRSANGRSAK
ncbi:MAG: helix-turn-helix domain-containing protein [Chitinophagaceae bacterium]|nr:MAG: helix-turn-helix domain-containing protein [Chitinophagaceae bacterium]